MKTYRITGLGNAIVDSLARADEDVLRTNDIAKGIMQLVDRDRARVLGEIINNARQVAGGSAANTIVTLAELGITTAFIGKTKDDRFGRLFAEGMRNHGVHFTTPPAPDSLEEDTAHSVILITPDGERSMNTYLGVAPFITDDDMEEEILAQTDWLYIEGYLWDQEQQKAACRKAIRMVAQAGGKIALTLSDPFCVERHRDSFLELVEEVDLVFANEEELLSLYQTKDFEAASGRMERASKLAAITRGAKGATILENGQRWHVPALENVELVDTTGAGDAFAAGYLYGHLHNQPHSVAGRLGCVAAAHVIEVIGGRSEADMRVSLARIQPARYEQS